MAYGGDAVNRPAAGAGARSAPNPQVGRPRILYLITRGEPGGAQMHVRELLRGFRERWEVHLGLGEGGFLAEEAARLGVAVRVLPHLVAPLRPRLDALAYREIADLIRAVKPDLVHAHSSKAGFLGRLAARRLGVPALFTAHGWAFAPGAPPPRRRLALAAERAAARWSARIIAVCEHDRRLALCLGVAAPDLVLTVPNGLPDTPHRARPGELRTHPGPPAGPAGEAVQGGEVPADAEGAGEVRVAMVARFAPPKDHAVVLRAAARLTRAGARARGAAGGAGVASWGRAAALRLVFVGDGPLRRAAERLAAGLGLAERVEFLGARHDVAQILAGCQAFVLASRYEGLPLTVLEAMRAGLPVVATDVGGVAEAVRDGETGYLVTSPARDPDRAVAELADRLGRLVADPALRARLGAAGRRAYEARFQLEPMLHSLERVYAEALAR